MKIVVTGANGYVGTRLVTIGDKHGHVIVVASRRPPIIGADLWIPFDIYKANIIELPSGTDAIVHLAVNTLSANSTDKESEINAAINLIKSAKEAGAKFIFVSSQTARENAPTSYGRTKWRIEQEVLAANGLVVRLGQVYGGFEQGLFGTLVRLVRSLPVLPAFIPSPLVQPIHVDDCAKGLLKLIERDDLGSGVYSLAAPVGVSFTGFLSSIAQYRVRHCKIFVPVPVFLIRFFIKLIGPKSTAKLGLHRLTSLFELPTMDTAADLNAIGLELRTLQSGMHRSGSNRRRRLIQEGTALLAYVLRVKPNSDIVRRYVRLIESLRLGVPLTLPSWLFYCPAALALLNDRASADSPLEKEFSWRVDAATVIAEASVPGAFRFLGASQENQFLTALTGIFLALSGEFFWRFLHLIAFPLLLRVKKAGSFDVPRI
ncbi:MAG: sugar nucleotide-binding protein [Methylobacter sp.]